MKNVSFICLNCNNEEFIVKKDYIEQFFRGKYITVYTSLTFCAQCGWKTVGNGQIDELIENTKNKYKEMYNS